MEIEFLDPDGRPQAPLAPVETIGPDGPERQPRWAFDRAVAAPAVLFGGAAALAAVAGFQTLYTVDRARVGGTAYAVDGWGRYRLSDGSPVPPGFHEARFGLALSCCAALLAIAAVVTAAALVTPLRKRMSARTLGGVAIVTGCGVAALVGLVAAMALQFNSVADINHISFATDASQVLGARPPRVSLGAAFWLSLAGVVAGGLGILGCLRLRRAWREPAAG